MSCSCPLRPMPWKQQGGHPSCEAGVRTLRTGPQFPLWNLSREKPNLPTHLADLAGSAPSVAAAPRGPDGGGHGQCGDFGMWNPQEARAGEHLGWSRVPWVLLRGAQLQQAFWVQAYNYCPHDPSPAGPVGTCPRLHFLGDLGCWLLSLK